MTNSLSKHMLAFSSPVCRSSKYTALEPDTPTCCSFLCIFLLSILTMLKLSTLFSLEYDMTVFCNFNDIGGACSTHTRKVEVYVKHEGRNFNGRPVSG